MGLPNKPERVTIKFPDQLSPRLKKILSPATKVVLFILDNVCHGEFMEIPELELFPALFEM